MTLTVKSLPKLNFKILAILLRLTPNCKKFKFEDCKIDFKKSDAKKEKVEDSDSKLTHLSFVEDLKEKTIGFINEFLKNSSLDNVKVSSDDSFSVSFNENKLSDGMKADGLTLKTDADGSNVAFGDTPIPKDEVISFKTKVIAQSGCSIDMGIASASRDNPSDWGAIAS